MQTKRAERLGDLIKEEIASIIQYGGIKDPRVGFVTITGVKLSGDLKNARVYFSMIGSAEDVKKSREGLASAAPYIRRELAGRLSVRFIPNLSFEFDSSLEYASRMETVFRKLKEEEGKGE